MTFSKKIAANGVCLLGITALVLLTYSAFSGRVFAVSNVLFFQAAGTSGFWATGAFALVFIALISAILHKITTIILGKNISKNGEIMLNFAAPIFSALLFICLYSLCIFSSLDPALTVSETALTINTILTSGIAFSIVSCGIVIIAELLLKKISNK